MHASTSGAQEECHQEAGFWPARTGPSLPWSSVLYVLDGRNRRIREIYCKADIKRVTPSSEKVGRVTMIYTQCKWIHSYAHKSYCWVHWTIKIITVLFTWYICLLTILLGLLWNVAISKTSSLFFLSGQCSFNHIRILISSQSKEERSLKNASLSVIIAHRPWHPGMLCALFGNRQPDGQISEGMWWL